MSIPIILRRMDDELMYSYLRRISIELLYPNFLLFLKQWVDVHTQQNYRIQYDIKKNYDVINEILGMPAETSSELFLETGLYPLYALVNKPYTNISYITNLTNILTKNNSLIRSGARYIKTLKSCPMCREDDEVFYYHRSHQIEGVKTCHIHGCRLEVPVGPPGTEFESEFRPIEGEINTIDRNYTVFVASLLKENITASNDVLAYAIRNRVIDLDYGFDRERFYKDIKPFQSLFLNQIHKLQSLEKLRSRLFGNIQDTLAYLFFLFRDVPTLQKYLNANQEFIKENQKWELFDQRCETCGNVYITNIKRIELGLGCPECDAFKEKEELAKDMIKAIHSDARVVIDGENVSVVLKKKLTSFRWEYILR